MIDFFVSAINLASSDVMVGFYLGAMCFCLGLVPAVAARVFTASLDEV